MKRGQRRNRARRGKRRERKMIAVLRSIFRQSARMDPSGSSLTGLYRLASTLTTRSFREPYRGSDRGQTEDPYFTRLRTMATKSSQVVRQKGIAWKTRILRNVHESARSCHVRERSSLRKATSQKLRKRLGRVKEIFKSIEKLQKRKLVGSLKRTKQFITLMVTARIIIKIIFKL